MGSLGGQDAGLKLQIDHLTAQLTEYQSQNANLQTQLSSCLGSQAGDTSMIATLQVEIQSKTTQIASLTSQLATCEAPLANSGAPQPIPARVDCGTIDLAPIYSLIQARWGIDLITQNKVLLSSGQYKITTIDSLMEFVRFTGVNKFPYIPTFHDCPDFAYALLGKFCNEPAWWGTALGVITIMSSAGWHRLNIAFAYPSDTNRVLTMYLIEPQAASLADAAFVGREACLILLP